ncbi:MAG: endonuclease/exonuclease/phosphatase family protein [Deltaproteobacteria bacterium]
MRRRCRLAGFALAGLLIFGGCGGDSDDGERSDITLANLNFLHGIFCPAQTESCRLDDRVELLADWIESAGCPDIVTLQEVWGQSLVLLESRVDTICPFAYELVQGEQTIGLDDETVLSRYPVTATAQRPLVGGFRNVLLTRVAHPTGPVDVFSTHLASGVDGARGSCGPECPSECVAADATTLRECQAVQMAEWIEASHVGPEPALIAGDFNAPPGSFEYRQFTGRGWSDAYLEAGNAECNPASGIGCTSGREDQSLVDMESPALGVSVRVDFIFIVAAAPGSSCAGIIEPAGDPDGDGAATGLFADAPTAAVETCGPLPAPICWPSDHIGVQVDLGCSW